MKKSLIGLGLLIGVLVLAYLLLNQKPANAVRYQDQPIVSTAHDAAIYIPEGWSLWEGYSAREDFNTYGTPIADWRPETANVLAFVDGNDVELSNTDPLYVWEGINAELAENTTLNITILSFAEQNINSLVEEINSQNVQSVTLSNGDTGTFIRQPVNNTAAAVTLLVSKDTTETILVTRLSNSAGNVVGLAAVEAFYLGIEEN